MELMRCKMCGGDLSIDTQQGYGTCEYCGSTMTLPKVSDERVANLFNRANHYRLQHDFDKALAAYENILNEAPEDAEAHWGVVLCRYGIEYVEDPVSHVRVPTCHRLQYGSVLNDADYLSALEHAGDGYVRSLYQKEAERIIEVQKGILAVSSREKPYDVFICYKENSESGTRTQDSTLAQDIYYHLIQEGYRVFFARITLEEKLGWEYEPYIFAALNSAKVMVVVGTRPEHYNAVWVRNEWSRFLAIMRKDRSRLLIPCYKDMNPYDLPEELSMLQSQDMGKIGFIQDLVRGMKKILDQGMETGTSPKSTTEKTMAGSANIGATPLLDRAFIFLDDEEFKRADEYFERVLDLEPKNARAYMGKFLVQVKCKDAQMLVERADESWFSHKDFKKAMQFATGRDQKEYASYQEAVLQKIARKREEERIRLEREAREEQERLEREAREKQERLEREAREEEERLEREAREEQEWQKQVAIEAEEKRKKRKIFYIFLFLILFAVASWFLVFEDMYNYHNAQDLMAAGSYMDAYEAFSALGDYKDSIDQATMIDSKYLHTVSFDSLRGSVVSELTAVVHGTRIVAPASPTGVGYSFVGWYKESGYVNQWDFAKDVVTADVTLYAGWRAGYSVGSAGPGGGLVFYDKGSVTDGWRYLEAAPASTEWNDKVWGGYGTSVGGTGTGIGTGRGNTTKIVAKYGNAEPYGKKTDYAAKLCSDLVYGGFSDWFLPSKDELDLMYDNLMAKGLGGFSDYGYWSSSEYSSYDAWKQYFSSGNQYNDYKGYNDYKRVRAVRAF